MVCSAGGGSGDIRPELPTDCPVLEDPLAGRPLPDVGFCDEEDKAIGMKPSFMTSQLGQMFSTGGEVLPELRAGDTAPLTADAMMEMSTASAEPDNSEEPVDPMQLFSVPAFIVVGYSSGANRLLCLSLAFMS